MNTHLPPRETLNLNGTWSIVFDPDNAGEAQGWTQKAAFLAQARVRSITVPSCWEEIEQDYEGVAWYGKAFDVPAAWQGKVVRLCFDAVNYIAEVWLNDRNVDYHEGGYTSFSFDVSDLLKYGQRNFLIVRVIGPLITRDIKIDGIGRDEMPHWRGALLGGIWQSVELLAVNRVHVEDLFVEPHIGTGAATVNVSLENTDVVRHSTWMNVCVAPLKEQDAIAHARLWVDAVPGTNGRAIKVKIENPVLWSPDNPYLYVAKVTVEEGGQVLDATAVRFGMREFTVQGSDFVLNGKPIFIKAAFWEGLYPSTLANPPDLDMVRREITLAKQAGFNTLRPWRKPQQPFILDLADELGIFVIACPPIECMNYWPQISPQLEWRLCNEVEQLVQRDRNHACVPYWELLNEVLRPALGRLKHKLSLLARRHDPTRMVIDESGGWSGGAHYYLPYSCEPVQFNELHCYLRAPVDDIIYDFLRTVGSPSFDPDLAPGMRASPLPGKITMVSEVGYGGVSDLSKDVARYRQDGNPKTTDYRYHTALLSSLERLIEEHNLHSVFPTTSDLCLASQEVQAVGNKRQIEALRLNPSFRGYCLHAYTDGDWIYGASILDIWREPKKAYAALGEANKQVYLAIRAQPPNVCGGQPTRISVHLVNETASGQAQLRLEVKDAQGSMLPAREATVTLAPGISHLLDVHCDTASLAGICSVEASLVQNGSLVSGNTYAFFVIPFEHLQTPEIGFDVFDPEGALLGIVQSRGLKALAFHPEQPSGQPVLVAGEHAANRQTFEAHVRLLDYVKRGGVAVFLNPPLIREASLRQMLRWRFQKPNLLPPEENSLLATGLFPLRIESRWGTGHWIPVNHVVREHPVFAGLPTRCFMGPEYQNVCPVETMIDLDGESIAGSISIELEGNHRNYLGLNRFYWGSDLEVVNHGKGKLILSTLRLVQWLGKDPVADVIFNNLLGYAASLAGSIEPAGKELQESLAHYGNAFKEWRTRLGQPV